MNSVVYSLNIGHWSLVIGYWNPSGGFCSSPACPLKVGLGMGACFVLHA